MLVDIVCLTHNQLSITKGFLEHIIKNTPSDLFELTFFDNGSTDGTVEYLESQGHKLIKSDVNLGVIKARNQAMKTCTKKYIINLDNDQYVQENWLTLLLNWASKGYDIAGVEAWSMYPPNTPGSVNLAGKTFNDRSYFPFKRCADKKESFTYIGCGGMIINTEIFSKIEENGNWFDESLGIMFWEDPSLCFRALQAGLKLGWAYDCDCNIKHLKHQTMNSQQTYNKSEEFAKSWQNFKNKWYPYFPPPMKMA